MAVAMKVAALQAAFSVVSRHPFYCRQRHRQGHHQQVVIGFAIGIASNGYRDCDNC